MTFPGLLSPPLGRWTSSIHYLTSRNSKAFPEQLRCQSLSLLTLTNPITLHGPGRLGWNIMKESPWASSTDPTLEGRSISTLFKSPLPILCKPHLKLIFRRVLFLSKIDFGPPNLFSFCLLLGGGLACKLSYLLKLKRSWGLWSQFMPHGTGKQGRQHCHSLLLPGHLIGYPQLWDLVNKPQITPVQYNLFNEALFRHCFQKHMEV